MITPSLTRIFALSAMLMTAEHAQSKDAGRSHELFGKLETPTVMEFPKWEEVWKRIKEEKLFYTRCLNNPSQCPTPKAAEWSELVHSLRQSDRQTKLLRVNDFFDGVAYARDMDLFGQKDYWLTPFEFMAVTGDCEDYAIAKYYTLRMLNFTTDSLRIVVAKIIDGEDHAFLAYFPPKGDGMLLDNTAPGMLIEQQYVTKYIASYGVNEEGAWIYSINAPAPQPSQN